MTSHKGRTPAKILALLTRYPGRVFAIRDVAERTGADRERVGSALSAGVRGDLAAPEWANVERVKPGYYRYTPDPHPEPKVAPVLNPGGLGAAIEAAVRGERKSTNVAVEVLRSTPPPAREFPTTDGPLYEYVTDGMVGGRQVTIVRDRVGALFAATPLTFVLA